MPQNLRSVPLANKVPYTSHTRRAIYFDHTSLMCIGCTHPPFVATNEILVCYLLLLHKQTIKVIHGHV